jgi:hypothetical protein
MTKTQKQVAIGIGVLAVLGIGAVALMSKPAAAAPAAGGAPAPSGGTTPSGGGVPTPPPGVLTPATTLQPNHEYQAQITGLPPGTQLSSVGAVQSFLDSSQGPGLFQVTNLTQSADGSTIVVSFNYLGTQPIPIAQLTGASSSGMPQLAMVNFKVYDLGPIPSAG